MNSSNCLSTTSRAFFLSALSLVNLLFCAKSSFLTASSLAGESASVGQPEGVAGSNARRGIPSSKAPLTFLQLELEPGQHVSVGI